MTHNKVLMYICLHRVPQSIGWKSEIVYWQKKKKEFNSQSKSEMKIAINLLHSTQLSTFIR